MTDFLWAIVSSDISLSAIGLLIIASSVVGYFPIVSSIPALTGYVTVARIAVILLSAALAFLIGFRVADGRAEAATLREKIAVKDALIVKKSMELELSQAIQAEAEAERNTAAENAKNAQDRINEYAERLKGRPNSACLLTPNDFADRVRNEAAR